MSFRSIYQVILFLGLQFAGVLSGQICSCGGAPLLNSLAFSGVERGIVRVALEYEYHNISDVVSGSRQLSDDSQWQLTQSGIFKISYGASQLLSVSALVTLVQKERAAADHRLVRGIGDGILLANLSLLPGKLQANQVLVLSGGLKAPLGNPAMELGGRLISLDLQPTSGGWDRIISLYGAHSFVDRPLQLFIQTSYRWTGTNEPYAFSDLEYKFGNEFVANLGVSYYPRYRHRTSLMLQYRISGMDRFGDFQNPNTGGQWIDLVPGIDLALTKASRLDLSGHLPLYRSLEGALQLTTSYSVKVALYYEFSSF